MYCEHFGFREKPFSMTPDPRFIFLSRNHREAFAHLLYGIDNRTGFIALTGEVGAGKTTVLRTLLAQLDPGRYCTALIFNPSPSPAELLRSINREFSIPAGGDDPARLLDALNEFLLEQNRDGKTVVLVIDEAQHLGPAVLEQVRLISNLETDRSKLIQIVLAGQPELGRMLSREELRQLDQRIAVRYHLRPMDFDDTAGYIAHRLGVVDGKGKAQFTRWALAAHLPVFRRASPPDQRRLRQGAAGRLHARHRPDHGRGCLEGDHRCSKGHGAARMEACHGIGPCRGRLHRPGVYLSRGIGVHRAFEGDPRDAAGGKALGESPVRSVTADCRGAQRRIFQGERPGRL